MKSMTGFGRGQAPLGAGRLSVEARSVNHRSLEVRVHGSRDATRLAPEVGEIVRRFAARGRVEVHLWLEGETGTRAALDVDLARAALRSLIALRDELAPVEPVPLALLAAVPDLFVAGGEAPSDGLRRAAQAAVERALEALDAARGREGEALGHDLAGRLAVVRELTERVRGQAPEALAAHRRRLRERLDRLLAGTEVPLDPGRLEQEMAVLADRTDVAEELTRLAVHCDALAQLLVTAEPVGRRLDFMLQELAREANTIGAKSQDASIAHLVVELKAEIERMREQAQNIE